MNSSQKKKGRIITALFIAALLMIAGWVVFSKLIRPKHYQLLRPYIPFFGKQYVVTKSRTGANNSLQIFIPEGKAILGKNEYLSETELSSFWIDQIPVTIQQYKSCVEKEGCYPAHYRDEYTDLYTKSVNSILPVTFISWHEAQFYCQAYGGHLPTEAQWEKAARGEEGLILYWEDDEKAFSKANYDNFFSGLTPSGWLPAGAGPFGLLDVSGNVREWVLDPFISLNQPVNTSSWIDVMNAVEDPDARLLKGGSFSDDLSHLRLNWRDYHDPLSPGLNRGFRCAYEK